VKKKAPGIAEGLLLVLATKDNPRLCRGGKNSLWRGAKKTRKSLRVRVRKEHIHMLISILPKYSVSQIMGYLKGKSSMMIFDRHANLKYQYGNRHFGARGHFVDTAGRNKKAIKAYIEPVGGGQNIRPN
jgi:hypothetical protein